MGYDKRGKKTSPVSLGSNMFTKRMGRIREKKIERNDYYSTVKMDLVIRSEHQSNVGDSNKNQIRGGQQREIQCENPTNTWLLAMEGY